MTGSVRGVHGDRFGRALDLLLAGGADLSIALLAATQHAWRGSGEDIVEIAVDPDVDGIRCGCGQLFRLRSSVHARCPACGARYALTGIPTRQTTRAAACGQRRESGENATA